MQIKKKKDERRVLPFYFIYIINFIYHSVYFATGNKILVVLRTALTHFGYHQTEYIPSHSSGGAVPTY